MYPQKFDLVSADSVDEALELKAEHAGKQVEFLAGGHSLIPTIKSGLASPDVLIDIGGIDRLTGIEDGDDHVAIGAMTRYATVAESESVASVAPAFSSAVAQIGDKQVRNMGTVGGNLAHADPASDLPGAALAADVTVAIQGPDGERTVAADDLFLGMYATDIDEDELMTEVRLPKKTGETVGTYAKKPSPSSGYALVGVAVQAQVDGGQVSDVRVGANGAMDHGVRLGAVEDALRGDSLTEETVERAASKAGDGLDVDMMMDDTQASPEFRAQLLTVYTERALTTLVEDVSAPAAAD